MSTASGLAVLRARALAGRAPLVVLVVALAARWWTAALDGPRVGRNGYDQSVYYAAADALVHGRVPYRGDFVFLHPPVVMLVGVPFAVLGRLTTASFGFLVENLAFGVLAAVTSALVTVVARRAGVGVWGATAGGLVHACWSVTVNAGSSVRLEPLGDLLLVLALAVLVPVVLAPGRTPTRRSLVAAGVLLGLLVDVKLWWAAPIAVVCVLTVVGLRSRAALLVPIAAAGTAVLVALPFLVVSGGRMVDRVVTTQLGRTDVQGTPQGTYGRLSAMVRLAQLTGVDGLVGGPLDGRAVRVVTVLVCLVVLLACVAAVTTSLGRLAVALLLTNVGVLLAAPVYFPYYGDFVGVPLALVVAAASTRRGAGLLRGGWPWWVVFPAGAAVSLVGLLTTPEPPPAVPPWDGQALAAASRQVPCVVADSPKVLIDLDALDRSFARGCRNWVDFQGVGHGGLSPDMQVQRGVATPPWRRAVARYLRSGDAVVISDPNVRTLLGPRRVRSLTSGPVIARSGGLTVHVSPRPTGASDGAR